MTIKELRELLADADEDQTSWHVHEDTERPGYQAMVCTDDGDGVCRTWGHANYCQTAEQRAAIIIAWHELGPALLDIVERLAASGPVVPFHFRDDETACCFACSVCGDEIENGYASDVVHAPDCAWAAAVAMVGGG